MSHVFVLICVRYFSKIFLYKLFQLIFKTFLWSNTDILQAQKQMENLNTRVKVIKLTNWESTNLIPKQIHFSFYIPLSSPALCGWRGYLNFHFVLDCPSFSIERPWANWHDWSLYRTKESDGYHGMQIDQRKTELI